MCPFSTHTYTHTYLFQPVLKSVEIARIVGPYTIYVNIFIPHSVEHSQMRKKTIQNKRKHSETHQQRQNEQVCGRRGETMKTVQKQINANDF